MNRSQLLLYTAVTLVLATGGAPIHAADMGTAFTYQGRLIDEGKPADGLYDLRLSLHEHPDPQIGARIGQPQYLDEVEVLAGHFDVMVDFGSEPFNGQPLWLEIAVRPTSPLHPPHDPKTYTVLEPRQPLRPTPYALYAAAGGRTGWAQADQDLHSTVTGNVGIGTSSPQDKLHVVGNVRIEGASPAWLHLIAGLGDDAGVRFGVAGVGSNNWTIRRDGASGDFHIQEMFPFPPFSGALVSIEAQTGNVGIGTDEPAAALHVEREGAGRQLAAYLSNPTDGPGTEVELQFGIGKLLPSGWSLRAASGRFTIANVAAFPPAVTITSVGRVGIGDTDPAYALELPNEANTTGRARANAWLTYSSRRHKTNIRPIDHAMEKVRAMRGVRFDWKTDGRADVGLIAEEVATVVPEVVDLEGNRTDARALAYGRLVAVLIEALKEQDQRIAELQQTAARYAQLQQRIDALESAILRRSIAREEQVQP